MRHRRSVSVSSKRPLPQPRPLPALKLCRTEGPVIDLGVFKRGRAAQTETRCGVLCFLPSYDGGRRADGLGDDGLGDYDGPMAACRPAYVSLCSAPYLANPLSSVARAACTVRVGATTLLLTPARPAV